MPVAANKAFKLLQDRCTVLTLLDLVRLKVTEPCLRPDGVSPSASEQRALVARQIRTTDSTCGFSQTQRIAPSNVAI